MHLGRCMLLSSRWISLRVRVVSAGIGVVELESMVDIPAGVKEGNTEGAEALS